MQKLKMFSFIVAMTVMLTACISREPVEVVKTPDVKTEYMPSTNADKGKLPKDVTAICVDGTYSTAPVEEACVGNGGKVHYVSRYHSN